jgi:hypothetical protein
VGSSSFGTAACLRGRTSPLWHRLCFLGPRWPMTLPSKEVLDAPRFARCSAHPPGRARCRLAPPPAPHLARRRITSPARWLAYGNGAWRLKTAAKGVPPRSPPTRARIPTRVAEFVGYAPQGVADLPAALALAEDVAFALVLADLHVSASRYALTPGHVLRRRVAPSPMGLFITPPFLTAEAVDAAGFAFSVPLPVNLETLLTQVAVALHRPLSRRQVRQAMIVASYLEALVAQRWDDLLACCTGDVVYQLPDDGWPTTSPAALRGQEEVRTYLTSVTPLYRPTYVAHLRVYPRPHGLIARCTSLWEALGGTRKQAATTIFFRFRGMRISQIGIPSDRLLRSEIVRVAASQ